MVDGELVRTAPERGNRMQQMATAPRPRPRPGHFRYAAHFRRVALWIKERFGLASVDKGEGRHGECAFGPQHFDQRIYYGIGPAVDVPHTAQRAVYKNDAAGAQPQFP